MKTETQIAESNIEELDLELPLTVSLSYPNCQEHKASCQRFLEFLTKKIDWNQIEGYKLGKDILQHKITDLENAIKKYDEAGI